MLQIGLALIAAMPVLAILAIDKYLNVNTILGQINCCYRATVPTGEILVLFAP